MTLHRPTNLMGLAAGREAGEIRPSPIAAGTMPLTAEERAEARRAHERKQAILKRQAEFELLRDDPIAFAKMLGAKLQPWQEMMLQALQNKQEFRTQARAGGKTARMQAHLELLAQVQNEVQVHVGVDMAKPDSEATAMVYLGTDGKYHVMGRQKGA